MNIIGLSAQQFDANGAGILRITPGSAIGIQAGGRRQTRTATLDGGSSLYDTGYTLSDQDWEIRTQATPEAETLIKYLCENYQRINASTVHGMVEASPQAWRKEDDKIILRLVVLGGAS